MDSRDASRNIYRKIAICIWTDDKWRDALTDDGRLVWYMLLSHRRTNRLGVHVGTAEMLAFDWPGGWGVDRMRAALDELITAEMVIADRRCPFVLWLRHFLRYNPPTGPNTVISWKSDAEEIPACPLRDRVLAETGALVTELDPTFGRAFARAFPSVKASPMPSGMASGMPSGKASRKASAMPSGMAYPYAKGDSGSGSGTGTEEPLTAVDPPAAVMGSQPAVTDTDVDDTREATTAPKPGDGHASNIIKPDPQTKADRSEVNGRSSVTAKGAGRANVAMLDLIETWNRIRTKHNHVKPEVLSAATKRGLCSALELRSLDQWEALFRVVEANDYLSGRRDGVGCSLFRAIEWADKIEGGHYNVRPDDDIDPTEDAVSIAARINAKRAARGAS